MTAAVALGLAATIGTEAFGLTVGVLGTVATFGAAVDARRSTDRIATLASESARAVQTVQGIAEDLSDASKAERADE